jgi:hypothetical protein
MPQDGARERGREWSTRIARGQQRARVPRALPHERRACSHAASSDAAWLMRTRSSRRGRAALASAPPHPSRRAMSAAPAPPSTAPLRPPLLASLLGGALAGLSVDLLFYPLDTLKTRLQARQGFWAAGGFKNAYRGVGSVAVGSAPGGEWGRAGRRGGRKGSGPGGAVIGRSGGIAAGAAARQWAQRTRRWRRHAALRLPRRWPHHAGPRLPRRWPHQRGPVSRVHGRPRGLPLGAMRRAVRIPTLR